MAPVFTKQIFITLLMKLTKECTFKVQVNGCTTGGPLSVTFSDIYMVKMGNDVVILSKPIFDNRFVDDIYSRCKLGDSVLFEHGTILKTGTIC